MIAFLSGKILYKGEKFVIVRAGNLGYKVFVSSTVYAALDVGREVEFYLYQHIREDAMDLYGFKFPEELEMFELLLSISGIGPKSALGVLAITSVADLKQAIISGDSSLLTKVSGIGRKTAERVVLELREKVAVRGIIRGQRTAGENVSAGGDEIDALMALGYSLSRARDALRAVDPGIKDSGERIKAALKGLGGQVEK